MTTAPCINCGTATENVEHVCQDCTAGARARLAVAQLSDGDLVAKVGPGRPAKNASRDAFSSRAIADELGTSEATVRRARQAEAERRGLAPPTAVQHTRDPDAIDAPFWDDGEGSARDDSPEDAAPPARPHVAQATGEVEWYTPDVYLDIARQTMGAIDLDPASSAIAQERVGAARHYTVEDDGLIQPWYGRVWLNPPYTAGVVDQFAKKLADEWDRQTITEAMWLSNNATETAWFVEIARISSAMLFPSGRIRFLAPDGERGTPLQGQVLAYIGPDVEMFAEAAGRIPGMICTPWRKEDTDP